MEFCSKRLILFRFFLKILAPPAARLDEVLGVECEGLLLLGCGDNAIGKVRMGTPNDAGG